jgi:hypothetical protein
MYRPEGNVSKSSPAKRGFFEKGANVIVSEPREERVGGGDLEPGKPGCPAPVSLFSTIAITDDFFINLNGYYVYPRKGKIIPLAGRWPGKTTDYWEGS